MAAGRGVSWRIANSLVCTQQMVTRLARSEKPRTMCKQGEYALAGRCDHGALDLSPGCKARSAAVAAGDLPRAADPLRSPPIAMKRSRLNSSSGRRAGSCQSPDWRELSHAFFRPRPGKSDNPLQQSRRQADTSSASTVLCWKPSMKECGNRIAVGNRRRCAEVLGIGVMTLYNRLSECNHCSGAVALLVAQTGAPRPEGV